MNLLRLCKFLSYAESTPTNESTLTFYSVNALYYVGFTTCTLSASIIFYQGLNTSDWISIISMMCGFLLNFTGVCLLTLSKTASSKDSHLESVRDVSVRSLDLSHGRYDHVRTSSVEIERARERRSQERLTPGTEPADR